MNEGQSRQQQQERKMRGVQGAKVCDRLWDVDLKRSPRGRAELWLPVLSAGTQGAFSCVLTHVLLFSSYLLMSYF